MNTIMIIDDDLHIGNLLEEALTIKGYGVSRAYSGTEAVILLEKQRPDLVLLDLMLPGLSGEEVLPQIKDIPVIVMSAKTDIDGKVELLLNGAVDYVTKPFSVKELLARISVHLRRQNTDMQTDTLKYDNIRLHTDTGIVKAGNTEIHLTRTEYAILKYLMNNFPQIAGKSRLLDEISADTPDCTESSLKTHISHLRNKLKAASGKDCIETVWGIGFRLKK